MKLFLVRNFVTKSTLGIFWASSKQDLWWMVDAFSDPSNYEFLHVQGAAGIVFEGNEPIPERGTEEDDAVRLSLSDASLQFSLENILHRYFEPAKWRRLPAADETGGGLEQVLQDAGARNETA